MIDDRHVGLGERWRTGSIAGEIYEPRMFFSVRDLLGNADDVANPRFGPYEVSYVSPAGEAFTGECE